MNSRPGLPSPSIRPEQVLGTKLHIPRLHSGLVSRSRLIDRIDQGTRRKLTLVSAPAGFGKSTLLAEWIVAADHPAVGWISLDASENEPLLFWTYFIRALRKVDPSVGEHALELLNSSPPVAIERVLT